MSGTKAGTDSRSGGYSEWPRYTGYDCKIRIYDRKTRTEQAERTALMEAWGDMRFYEK